MKWWKRARLPLLVFVVTSGVYAGFLGDRFYTPTAEGRQYTYLAQSFLEGQLGVVGDRPPSFNDWACFDTEERGPCPPNRFAFPGQGERYRWYVSFPPFPAVVILPAVLAFGTDVWDRAFWTLLAGLGPALLFVLLRFLRESGLSGRSLREDLSLVALFAFGSVYFFNAVQGTVWFAAHVVAIPLLCLYVLFAFGARRPFWAGLALALAFASRPTTAFLVVFFAVEVLKVARTVGPDPDVDPEAAWYIRAANWVRRVQWSRVWRPVAIFSAPILVVGGALMWMNATRFGSPFEFGHTYLQIFWRDRIERWGLFNYHYFGRNLAVFVASLPWLSALPPYLKISRHGLSLWVTTPQLWLTLFPRSASIEERRDRAIVPTMVGLLLAVVVVAVLNLCYQNSGWEQFGYRFALDYLPLLFALLAIGGRPFRGGFYLLLVWAIAVNGFGAATYHRAPQFYDGDGSQKVIFQPD